MTGLSYPAARGIIAGLPGFGSHGSGIHLLGAGCQYNITSESSWMFLRNHGEPPHSPSVVKF